MADRVYLYDTTLRDGAQTQGVDFGVADKRAIAEALDGLGIDYVEGGWPGANPTDDAFFAAAPRFGHARFTINVIRPVDVTRIENRHRADIDILLHRIRRIP